MTITNQVSAVVPGAPDAVFDCITDIDRLPGWNAAMTSVVAKPDNLAVGSEWLVEFHALGSTWRSRSTLEVIDQIGRRFTYRSGTDDGNPSFARWTWEVDPDPAGSRVTVRWSLEPATFWRRVLLARVRGRQLARTEVPASLAALAAAVTGASSGVRPEGA